MNLQQPGQLQPMEILRAVRKGYALAMPSQIELMKSCGELDCLNGGWVPRWALEAVDLLEAAGCAPSLISGLFAQGQQAIKAELADLVREKRLAHPIELRRLYTRLPIDLATERALKGALQHHRNSCSNCRFTKACAEGADLQDQLDLLFPPDRRVRAREPHVA